MAVLKRVRQAAADSRTDGGEHRNYAYHGSKPDGSIPGPPLRTYDPVLAALAPLRLCDLIALYQRAGLGTGAGMSRDTLIADLRDYAKGRTR